MYKPREVWSVRASGAKERMAEINSEISWVPTDYGAGRFGTFLEEAKDWVVSRSRYWGTPLPVWRCPSGHEVCVGSVEELVRLSGEPLPEPLDLHRPSVDSVRLRCPECGDGMDREQDVLDCWYDSGCAPFAQYHYPFENIAEFETHRSVDFITESSDQTRGWFYTQHVVGTLLFDAPAFRSVLVVPNLLDSSKVKHDFQVSWAKFENTRHTDPAVTAVDVKTLCASYPRGLKSCRKISNSIHGWKKS